MRKKLIITFFFITTMYCASTQTNYVTILDSSKMIAQRWVDTCFGLLNLSPSQIPSGYLLDYSVSAFNDSNFNSLISANIDTIPDRGIFFSLHNILTASVVNGNASPIGNTDSLFINAYRYQRNTGNIPILLLYQPYQKIRATALSQGLFNITTDSFRLEDVTGRLASPYDNESLFAFTPFQNQINQYGNITFALPSQLWLMPGITSVQIDFGDGMGFRTLLQGNTVSVSYNSSGTYYLNAKITTTSGVLVAKSSIQYTQPKYYITPDSVWNISVAPLYTSISSYIGNSRSVSQPQGILRPLGGTPSCTDGSVYDMASCDINPGAKVEIITGCDHVFDKPIIVVEGFDPTNSVTFNSLIGDLDINLGLGTTDYYTTMRQAGYDFVFVIFTKNTDFIENNAMVLEQVIEKVNNVKSGTNKNTVIGFSMGGLIARWALKDMEDNGINHQVGNYFSYDSPHQGANVPLGLQWLFLEMLNDIPYLKHIQEIDQLYSAYTSIAGQQMLVTYANGSNGIPVNPLRSAFAQNLINKGYPHTTTNYGISQGRGNNTSGTTNAGVGTQFGFTPGSSIFHGAITFLLTNLNATAYAVSTSNIASILSYHFYGIKVSSLFGIPIPSSLPIIKSISINYKSAYPYDDAHQAGMKEANLNL